LRALILLLFLIPLLDLGLLVFLARAMGRPATLLWLGSACAAGGVLVLAARQGLRGGRPGLRRASAPISPFRFLAYLAAGALLIFPGPLTDLAAILLLIPSVRGLLTKLLALRLLGSSLFRLPQNPYDIRGDGDFPRSHPHRHGPPGTRMREAEFEVVDEPRDPSDPPGPGPKATA
jgi:UPF0716 protein FxsA